jgi:hypothetical protein
MEVGHEQGQGYQGKDILGTVDRITDKTEGI